MTKKKPSQAIAVIESARLIPGHRGPVCHPSLIYAGDPLVPGTAFKVTLENGVTYSGTVADATEADGQVLIELQDGLTPEA